MDNGETEERKHVSLAGGQKVELLLKLDRVVAGSVRRGLHGATSHATLQRVH